MRGPNMLKSARMTTLTQMESVSQMIGFLDWILFSLLIFEQGLVIWYEKNVINLRTWADCWSLLNLLFVNISTKYFYIEIVFLETNLLL